MSDIENQEKESEVVNQDIGSALENVTEEELQGVDTFEEFLAQQGVQPDDNQTSQEPTQQTEPESNSEQETTEGTEQSNELSDKEFRELVTATFRANHQDVQMTDPDDIRKLMQYGMNYHKKMGELAPHRKILKSLEQHGLLEQDKINFAIDLLKGDKTAIAKFLKDQSVDTYELPDIEETPYQAKNYMPTDERIVFEEKTQELQGSEAGRKVLSYIQNLDENSFVDVYTNPIMLDNLARHAESGLMNDALATLEKEYALGRVPANIKGIDAYAFVAEQLEKQNPTKYLPQQYRQPKVLGNNLNQGNTVTTGSNVPASAGIPNNRQAPQQQQSYSGIDTLLNASEEELAKYASWEEFIQANNIKL